MSRPARRVAIEILRDWEKGGRYAADLIEIAHQDGILGSKDRGLVQHLCYSVIRNQLLLGHLIKKLTDGKLDPKTKRVLRLGIAEILFLETSAHATVNETVKLANGWAKGVVNAVLRRAVKEKELLEKEILELAPEIRMSVPRFLWKRWRRDFGEENAIKLAEWNQKPAPVYLRVNKLKANGDILADTSAVEGYPDYVAVEGALPLSAIDQGYVYAQDPSTASAIELLDPETEDRILDACAAPGGKTFAIACKMGGRGSILASDSSQRRVTRLTENLERLGVQNTEIDTIDWLRLNELDRARMGLFSKALVDVPCSNTGVIRRRIDARWRLSKTDFAELPEIQLEILKSVGDSIAPGGRIVYSTCSIDPEENEAVVERFTKGNPRFTCVEQKSVLPWRDGFDGAFGASIMAKD